MSKLIINADDFGYCEAVNYGIISAHRNGVVTSTTIMANMPGFEHAIELLKDNKNLGCGVHMTLSCGKPINNNLTTLVNENNTFHRYITEDIIDKIDLDEVYEELCSQINKVKNVVDISHLDSHHHIHTLKGFEQVISSVLKKYDLPIRGGFEYNNNYEKQIKLVDSFYSEQVSYEFFKENRDILTKYDVVDIMTHPAFLDDFILNSTSYAINRTKEHKILTSKEVKDYLYNNFELTNYKKL